MKDTGCTSPSPQRARTWDPELCRDKCSPTSSKHLGASCAARSGHRSAIGYSKMFTANLRCCLKEWKSQPRCDGAQSAGKSLQFQGPWGRGPAASASICGSILTWETLKKRRKEPRTRVRRCLVLGARYSAVVYSSSKTITYSGCLPDTAWRAWPGGVAGKRLSPLTMLCLASAELGLVSLKWSLWISRPILFKRDPYGMGNVTIGPQVGGPLCSERVTETGQNVSRLPWRRATPSLLYHFCSECELTSRNFYSSGLLN